MNRGASAIPPAGFHRKTPIPPQPQRQSGKNDQFPFAIIILARAARACLQALPAARDVASTQQRARRVNSPAELPCQRFRPFGTMGRNFSQS
jgi:hypothetical protein